MTVFSVILLVCAASVPPSDCNTSTARQTMRAPADMASCGMPAMAFGAGLATAPLRESHPRPGDRREYVKIVCLRQKGPEP